ncbi:Ig-like domain-containing protein, partial [Acinetobacter sp. ANC 3832]|uniref:Ig-like domain-containing protein n=1 Tax=Acinetobacter sp. ANC 3832 TaxID=1977874 RepID=UPI000B75B39D
MTRIVVVAKNGGDLLQDTQASDVVLNQASVVQVGVTKEHVESILREGNSVVITLKDGEKIVIENFFNDANNADNSLVFPEQDKGFALVEFDAAGKGVNYAGLESVEPLIYSDGNAGLIPWLFPVVTAGGILWWAHRHDKGDGADTTSPTAKAVLTGVTEDTGVNLHDFITQDNTLVFNGKITGPLAADEKIQVSLDGGKTWVDAVVDRGNGSWSYDNTKTPLADGTYTVQVRTIDASGNVGSVTEQKVVIDTQAPVEGSLSDLHLTDDVGPVVGEIKNGTQTDDTRPEFSGKATPEVEHVNIYDNGQLIGTATVKADGTWTFTPETPLSGGAHSLTATPVDQAGNEGKPTAPIGFNVVGDAPPAPTIQTVADDFGSVQGPIQKNGVTDDKTPTISGTAQPGSVVHVYVDGKEVGTATVSPDKTWSLELPNLGVDGPKNI